MKRNQKTSDRAPETACPRCGLDQLLKGDLELNGERYGETFVIRMPALRCDNCSFETIDSAASAEFTRLVSDAYRIKHGLLTGGEIRGRREQLKMSQQQFAEYLGVGVASVKRWELGQVQDKAMDELIRLKTDPEAARSNLKALELQVPEHLVLSSVRFGGEDLELEVVFKQGYIEQKPMRIDRSELQVLFSGEESLAA